MTLHSECLKGMKKRPALYFTPPLFHALQHYVLGVRETLEGCDLNVDLRGELDGFDEWVCRRFEIDMPHTTWAKAISLREPDDAARVALFAELLLTYRDECATRRAKK